MFHFRGCIMSVFFLGTLFINYIFKIISYFCHLKQTHIDPYVKAFWLTVLPSKAGRNFGLDETTWHVCLLCPRLPGMQKWWHWIKCWTGAVSERRTRRKCVNRLFCMWQWSHVSCVLLLCACFVSLKQKCGSLLFEWHLHKHYHFKSLEWLRFFYVFVMKTLLCSPSLH